MKMQENKIIKLNDIEHALLRAPMYIGAITPQKIKRPIIVSSEDHQKIVIDEIEYIPGLLKLMRELLDNSIDEYLRTQGNYANKISIIIDDEKFVVEDNGRGIPIKPAYDSQGNEIPDSLMPLMAWTNLKAGSNFDDSNTSNTSIGQNGVGSSLATIFSKKFIGETDDGNKFFKVTCKNNMQDVDYKVTDSKKKMGTKVTFYPDLERFKLDKIDEIYKDLIYFDLIFLSVTYPEIQFKFNGKVIKINNLNSVNKLFFDGKLNIIESDNVSIAVGGSDTYNFIHFVNGVNAYEGGSTLEYVERRILIPVTEKLQKRYKNIKFADVRNKIFLIVVYRNIPNPRFTSQMKTATTNTPSKFPEIANEVLEIAKSRFIDKIYKDKSITGPIIDFYKAKEMVQDKKEIDKTLKKIKTPVKYWKAGKQKKYFIISEGDSAIGSIINGVGRDFYGFYPIKGKTSNVLKDPKKLKTDKELMEIAKILGIDFSGNQEKLEYENIVIGADADFDGFHINILLVSYFYMTAQTYLKTGKIHSFRTPIVVIYKNDKIDKMIFDFQELKEFEKSEEAKGCVFDYKKGLGSLTEEEWEEMFKRYSFEDLLLTFKFTEEDEKTLLAWMQEDREYRKNIIKKNIELFDINAV